MLGYIKYFIEINLTYFFVPLVWLLAHLMLYLWLTCSLGRAVPDYGCS